MLRNNGKKEMCRFPEVRSFCYKMYPDIFTSSYKCELNKCKYTHRCPASSKKAEFTYNFMDLAIGFNQKLKILASSDAKSYRE